MTIEILKKRIHPAARKAGDRLLKQARQSGAKLPHAYSAAADLIQDLFYGCYPEVTELDLFTTSAIGAVHRFLKIYLRGKIERSKNQTFEIGFTIDPKTGKLRGSLAAIIWAALKESQQDSILVPDALTVFEDGKRRGVIIVDLNRVLLGRVCLVNGCHLLQVSKKAFCAESLEGCKPDYEASIVAATSFLEYRLRHPLDEAHKLSDDTIASFRGKLSSWLKDAFKRNHHEEVLISMAPSSGNDALDQLLQEYSIAPKVYFQGIESLMVSCNSVIVHLADGDTDEFVVYLADGE